MALHNPSMWVAADIGAGTWHRGRSQARHPLSYPAAANEPPRVLKGFDKVALKAKESKTVTIPVR